MGYAFHMKTAAFKSGRARWLGLVSLSSLLAACAPDPSASDTASDMGGSTETTESSETGEGGVDGGEDGADTGGTGGAQELPGEDTTVVAFQDEHLFFGDENRRQVDVEVSFPPEASLFSSVTLNFSLGCPNDNCDDWDRYGTLGVVENPGTDEERFIEIQRFVTPYGIGGAWSVDVTMLQPMLAGDLTLRVFIDTWVGPGHPQGDGWLFSADFEFVGGTPNAIPDAVVPIWYERYNAGHPEMPIDAQVVDKTVEIPGTPKNAAIRSFITGHGFGNADNCAEFCPLNHTFTVNEVDHTQLVWRENCSVTGVPGQQGTWTFPRAGWCPGADAYPILEDVTAEVSGASSLDIRYALEDYVNECRPDAPVCMGCVGGATCDDGHGQPYYYLSAMLVTFRASP